MEKTRKCPKCNYTDSASEFEICPSCGIVVYKFLIVQREKQKYVSIPNILKRFENRFININLDHPTGIKKVQLFNVGDDCFSVMSENMYFHFPFNQIVSLIESQGNSRLMVQVFHLVIYKGATTTSFGTSFPV